MRVVAGTVGGRRLQVPDGPSIRPTSELVRGAVFNSLASLLSLDDAEVVDLFAGSGALGIEALSRGATSATFVDSDRRAVAAVRANLGTLGLLDRATVVVTDAVRWVADNGVADLFLIDPPYAFAGWEELLAGIEAAVVVCESDHPLEPHERWEVARLLRHGGTVVSLLQPRGAPAL